jgi:hypothetical protein
MPWGESHVPSSTGTTAQIELAHAALDDADVPPGPLATRTLNLLARKSTVGEWLRQGVAAGFVTEHCYTHDVLYTDEEAAAFDNGADPCVPILRVRA